MRQRRRGKTCDGQPWQSDLDATSPAAEKPLKWWRLYPSRAHLREIVRAKRPAVRINESEKGVILIFRHARVRKSIRVRKRGHPDFSARSRSFARRYLSLSSGAGLGGRPRGR